VLGLSRGLRPLPETAGRAAEQRSRARRPQHSLPRRSLGFLRFGYRGCCWSVAGGVFFLTRFSVAVGVNCFFFPFLVFYFSSHTLKSRRSQGVVARALAELFQGHECEGRRGRSVSLEPGVPVHPPALHKSARAWRRSWLHPWEGGEKKRGTQVQALEGRGAGMCLLSGRSAAWERVPNVAAATWGLGPRRAGNLVTKCSCAPLIDSISFPAASSAVALPVLSLCQLLVQGCPWLLLYKLLKEEIVT